MAKNWTVAEATEEILNGNKEAVVDIGRRFPLAARAIAVAGEGAKEILSALNFITVRKIESVLKDGVEEYSEDDVEDPTEKPAKKTEKPVKEKKAPAKKEEKPVKKTAAKKKEEPAMNEPEEDDEDYESMSEVELFKICKKKGLKPAPKQKKQYYLDLLNPASEEESWDEEEDEKPAKKASAKKSKKAAEDEDDDWDI